MVGVVVGQQQARNPSRVDPRDADVLQNATHACGGTHAAVHKRELIPTVEEINVRVEVAGQPEAGQRAASDKEYFWR